MSAGSRTVRWYTPKSDVNNRINIEFSMWLFAAAAQCEGADRPTNTRYVSASSMVIDWTAARAITHNQTNAAVEPRIAAEARGRVRVIRSMPPGRAHFKDPRHECFDYSI